MRQGVVSVLVVTAFLAMSRVSSAQTLPPVLQAQVKSPFFENLYAHTYYGLLDRSGPDGFLPESITGAYEGMYCIWPFYASRSKIQTGLITLPGMNKSQKQDVVALKQRNDVLKGCQHPPRAGKRVVS